MQQRSEETRMKIFASALVVFGRVGYDAAGVAEICAAAGVSKGAFYYHFPSKQALFMALLDDWLAGLDQQLNAMRSQQGSAGQTLLHLPELIPQVVASASGYLPMFLEFWVQASRDPQIWQHTVEPYQRYRNFLTDLVRQAIEEGSINSGVDANAAGFTLVSLAVGILLQTLVGPAPEALAQPAQASLEQLLGGWLVSKV